jgi:hypothetical protein
MVFEPPLKQTKHGKVMMYPHVAAGIRQPYQIPVDLLANARQIKKAFICEASSPFLLIIDTLAMNPVSATRY